MEDVEELAAEIASSEGIGVDEARARARTQLAELAAYGAEWNAEQGGAQQIARDWDRGCALARLAHVR